jgi:hypothetical protein
MRKIFPDTEQLQGARKKGLNPGPPPGRYQRIPLSGAPAISCTGCAGFNAYASEVFVGRRDASNAGRPVYPLMMAAGLASSDGVESRPPGAASHPRPFALGGHMAMRPIPRWIDQTFVARHVACAP